MDVGKAPAMSADMPLMFPRQEYVGLTGLFVRTNNNKQYLIPIQFAKLGPRDLDNRNCLRLKDIAGWFEKGTVEKLGETFDDVHIVIAPDLTVLSSGVNYGMYLARRLTEYWWTERFLKGEVVVLVNS